MYHEVERYESEKYPGLVAVVFADPYWEDNPLDWVGIKERGEGSLVGGGRWNTDDDPRTIWTNDGETVARSEAEYLEHTHGVAAAVPVSYWVNTSQPGIREVDWGDEESCSAVLYLEVSEVTAWTADDIRVAMSNLTMAWQEGFYFVKVEVDPDSDLPDDVVPTGSDLDGVGGILGFDGYREAATELLAQAESEVEGELARRLEWAKRDVVTK